MQHGGNFGCCIALIGLFAFCGSGCTTFHKKVTRRTVMPEMFGNQLPRLMENFEKIVSKKTTLQDLEAMGFKLKEEPRTGKKSGQKGGRRIYSGIKGYEQLFGKDTFRNLTTKELETILTEMESHTVYQIPYVDVTTVADRFYVNRQNTETKGPDVLLTIILKDGLVIHKEKIYVDNDSYEYRKALFRGFLDAIGEFLDPVSGTARAF